MDDRQLQTTYRRQAYLLLGAAWLAGILMHYHNLYRPFWHDELISLHYFQLVPLRTTLTDYSDVNNHVGFNLLCNVYLKLTGQHDFLTLVYHPERLRILLLLLITCATVWAAWKLSLEIGGLRLALVNLVLLLTTLPFYNFTMQLRGYGLCILIVLVWMRYLYRYCVSGGWQNLLGTAVFITALLYTHPGNIFLVMAMFPSALLLVAGRAQKGRFLLRLWAAMAVGTGLGIALYLPMLHTLFHSPQVGLVEGGYQAGFFYRILGANTYFFLSARYPALIAGVTGAWLVLRQRTARPPVQVVFWGFCIVLYIAAYVVAFLRRDDVFVRIFVPGAGLFILALGMGVHWCLEQCGRYRAVLTGFVVGSCLVIFPFQIRHRNQVVDAANAQGVLCNNLYYTYFAHNFQPFRLTDLIRERSREPGFLLFCISQYKRDATEVLDALHIPYHLEHEPDEVNRLTAGHDHWYLMTMHDLTYFKRTYPDWRFEQVNSEPYFNNFYRVTRR